MQAPADTSAEPVVAGLQELMQNAFIPEGVAVQVAGDIRAIGAVNVQEVTQDDWTSLPGWAGLRPLEARRLLRALQSAFVGAV